MANIDDIPEDMKDPNNPDFLLYHINRLTKPGGKVLFNNNCESTVLDAYSLKDEGLLKEIIYCKTTIQIIQSKIVLFTYKLLSIYFMTYYTNVLLQLILYPLCCCY